MSLPQLPKLDSMSQAKYLKTLPGYIETPLPQLLKLILTQKQSGLLLSTPCLNFGRVPSNVKSLKFIYITMRVGSKFSKKFEIRGRGVDLNIEKKGELFRVRVGIAPEPGEFRGSITISSEFERKMVVVTGVGIESKISVDAEVSMSELQQFHHQNNSIDISENDDDQDFQMCGNLDLKFVRKIQDLAMPQSKLDQKLKESHEMVAKRYGFEIDKVRKQFKYERRGSVEQRVEFDGSSTEDSQKSSRRDWDNKSGVYRGIDLEISVLDWFMEFGKLFD
ncbi:hypothetical protein SS50377_26722 [Spironucleus salmonicida]|uniref:Uncharacterized protein n=1 Tax=Spironucleus salmonicida TaxID=348837 RepID=V6LY83_9EUKA|nr:hypothetical protein SS50377_26722 [Spironucleus salmonicida]|eukprot:EST49193.1 Hypothetical protein SS50377_10409 [Spironucleus salmonicida]